MYRVWGLFRAAAALSLSVCAFCSPSSAADFFDAVSGRITNPTPAEQWGGLYIGGTLGYGWTRSELTDVYVRSGAGSVSAPVSGIAFGEDGVSWGATAGYNFYASGVVAGIEADLSYGRFVKTLGTLTATSVLVPGDSLSASARAGTSYHGTIRGRIGYLAVPDLLVYGTGGIAIARSEAEASFTYDDGSGPQSIVLSDSGISTGYVLGVGLEDHYTERTSIKLEYLYMTIPGQDFAISSNGVTVGVQADTSVHMVRTGLNYHF